MNSLYLAEFDVPVILIVFVVISAIKWFMERIKAKGEQPYEESESLEDIYENFREEIQQRQTTVQQPPAQTPPPIPQSPPSVQHVQHVQRQPEPVPVRQPKPRQPIELTSEQKAAAERFQQLGTGIGSGIGSAKRKRSKAPQTSVRAMLANPEATQQAIILTEILGKPKSLQDA